MGETLPENSAWVEDKQTVSDINNNLGNDTIKHIVFDKSFSTYTPTSLNGFFTYLKKLETITGLDATVLGLIPIDDQLIVTEELGDWVKVNIEEGDGYVSTDYVTLSTEFVKAESKEEEEARLAKEEAERKAAQAAAKAAALAAARCHFLFLLRKFF